MFTKSFFKFLFGFFVIILLSVLGMLISQRYLDSRSDNFAGMGR